MKIAIIGTGNLGYSIAMGILSQDNFNFESLYLTKRNTASLMKWEELPKVKISTDNKDGRAYLSHPLLGRRLNPFAYAASGLV